MGSSHVDIVSRRLTPHDRSSNSTIRASRFLLSLASPVLHRMLCAGFRETATRRLELDDVDEAPFTDALRLWRGAAPPTERPPSAMHGRRSAG